MRFHAFHGVLPSEKEEGGEYIVDFRCSMDLEPAAASDDLADTLDYSAVYRIAQECMAKPSNLIENVAGRIRDAIAEAFPQLPAFEVTVSKLQPPVGGHAEAARVTLRGGSGR